MTNSETSSDSSTEQLSRLQSKLDLSSLRETIRNDSLTRGIDADREIYEQKDGGTRSRSSTAPGRRRFPTPRCCRLAGNCGSSTAGRSVGASTVSSPTAPELPREVPDLACQIAHRPKPGPGLLRAEAMPVVSVAFALRPASAGRTTVHPAPRAAVHRR